VSGDSCQLAVIGAGPAGLAAAIEASAVGLSVVVLDEQPLPGGQIYRSLEQQKNGKRPSLGSDYEQGRPLLRAFRDSSADYRPLSQVWEVTPQRHIHYNCDGISRCLRAEFLIIAGGAQERPVPIPGWTLPGVMTAGAAQILLKSAALGAPQAVFAGSGPLLYLVAWQYLQAGLPIAAILETTPRANYLRAAPYLPAVLTLPSYLTKGFSMMAALRRAGVPWIKGVTGLRAEGDEQLEAIAYRVNGDWRRVESDHLFLHQGIVPNTNLTVSIGCHHVWNERQTCWQVQRDDWGVTSVEGVAVAGDGGGIGGAIAAQLQGRLAALGAAHRQGSLSGAERDQRARPLRRLLTKEYRVRAFLDTLYRPADWLRRPMEDETVVCRCEGVTAGEVRAAAALGCPGPNQLKAFTRAGMGPCQSRQCGLTVGELIAETSGMEMAETGYLRTRPPIKPISLGSLATFDDS